MTHRGTKRIAWIRAAAVVFAAGVALGSVTAADHQAVHKITQFGERFGWVAHIVPPDTCVPPDPYCKARVALGIDTSVRTDLDQQLTLFHAEAGEGVSPCVRVLHQFLADGSMSETVDILGSDDAVQITVPEGFQLIATDTGYALAPMVGDVEPPQ